MAPEIEREDDDEEEAEEDKHPARPYNPFLADRYSCGQSFLTFLLFDFEPVPGLKEYARRLMDPSPQLRPSLREWYESDTVEAQPKAEAVHATPGQSNAAEPMNMAIHVATSELKVNPVGLCVDGDTSDLDLSGASSSPEMPSSQEYHAFEPASVNNKAQVSAYAPVSKLIAYGRGVKRSADAQDGDGHEWDGHPFKNRRVMKISG